MQDFVSRYFIHNEIEHLLKLKKQHGGRMRSQSARLSVARAQVCRGILGAGKVWDKSTGVFTANPFPHK